MYHCHIRFYLAGRQNRVFEIIKGAFPLDTGEKLAYNDNSQSADREQYRTAGFRERMAGASPPKLGWEGALERGEEMPCRSPPLPG